MIFIYIFKIYLFFIILINNVVISENLYNIKKINLSKLSIENKIFIYNIINKNFLHNKININLYVLRKIIKEIYRSNIFLYVGFYINKNNIFFNIIEKPIINKIEINGNNIFNKKMLLNLLKKNEIKTGNFLNIQNIIHFKNNLTKLYIKKGRYNSCINIKNNIFHDKNKINIQINIYEGNYYNINNIFFINNNLIEIKDIKKIFYKNFFSIKNDNIYIKNDFLNKLNNLKKYYILLGYLDFRIIKIIILNKKNNKNIYILIKKGKLYNIKDTFCLYNKSNYKLDLNDIKKKISNLKKEHKIDIKFIKDYIKNKILEKYKNINLSNININFIIKKNFLNNKKILLFIINNNIFFVRNIYIIGNNNTNKSFILENLTQKKFSHFNKNFFLKDLYYIKNNFFKKIKYKFINYKEGNFDIIIYVNEFNKLNNIFISLKSFTDYNIDINLIYKKINILGTQCLYKLKLLKERNNTYLKIKNKIPIKINEILNNNIIYNKTSRKNNKINIINKNIKNNYYINIKKNINTFINIGISNIYNKTINKIKYNINNKHLNINKDNIKNIFYNNIFTNIIFNNNINNTINNNFNCNLDNILLFKDKNILFNNIKLIFLNKIKNNKYNFIYLNNLILNINNISRKYNFILNNNFENIRGINNNILDNIYKNLYIKSSNEIISYILISGKKINFSLFNDIIIYLKNSKKNKIKIKKTLGLTLSINLIKFIFSIPLKCSKKDKIEKYKIIIE